MEQLTHNQQITRSNRVAGLFLYFVLLATFQVSCSILPERSFRSLTLNILKTPFRAVEVEAKEFIESWDIGWSAMSVRCHSFFVLTGENPVFNSEAGDAPDNWIDSQTLGAKQHAANLAQGSLELGTGKNV